MSTGLTDLGYKTVCYGTDGAMLYGERKIGGEWYHFDEETGAMSTGMTDLGYKTVLYGEDGAFAVAPMDQADFEKWEASWQGSGSVVEVSLENEIVTDDLLAENAAG